MSDVPAIYLDATNAEGVGVRVQFSRTGDRYTHAIYALGNDGKKEPLLNSHDDAAIIAGFAFPTWQEVRAIESSGTKVLALIGSDTGRHWSASICRRQFMDASIIEFELAVRLHAAPAPLAVAYRTTPGATWVDLPSAGAFAATESSRVAIMSPLTMDPDLPAFANDLNISSLAEYEDCRVFEPTLPTPRTYPATLQWRYWIGGPM